MGTRSGVIRRVWLLLGASAVLLAGAPSHAAFPGTWNGAIAYARGDDIWVMDEQGNSQRSLLHSNGKLSSPRWSADGGKLAFRKVYCSPACNAYTIDAATIDGKDLSTGVDNTWGLFGPAWSPDGTMIAFTSSTYQGRTLRLFLETVTIATGKRRVLHELTGSATWSPSWSPDGSRIAFTKSGDVFTIDPQGNGLAQLTSGQDHNFSPDWSPDGSRIVFTSTRDGSEEIYVMDANGGGQTRLTQAPGDDFDPTWSPDGTMIAFAHTLDEQYDIAVMDADGSNVRNLTESNVNETSPSWQPVIGIIPCAAEKTSRQAGVARPGTLVDHPVVARVAVMVTRAAAPARVAATAVHNAVVNHVEPVSSVAYALC